MTELIVALLVGALLLMLVAFDEVFEDGVVGIIDAWRRVWRWNVVGFRGVWRTLARLGRDRR